MEVADPSPTDSKTGRSSVRERGLAEPAEAQAGERDAELAGRQVAVDVLHLLAREHGAAAPLLGELLQPGRAGAGQGELGRDEEAVQQHQEECRDDLDRVRQRSVVVSTGRMILEAPADLPSGRNPEGPDDGGAVPQAHDGPVAARVEVAEGDRRLAALGQPPRRQRPQARVAPAGRGGLEPPGEPGRGRGAHQQRPAAVRRPGPPRPAGPSWGRSPSAPGRGRAPPRPAAARAAGPAAPARRAGGRRGRLGRRSWLLLRRGRPDASPAGRWETRRRG